MRYYPWTPKTSPFHLANLPQQIYQVSVQIKALWRKYHFLLMQMVWNFYSASICLNYWSPPNLGHFHLANWPQHHHFHFWPVCQVAKEVPSSFAHLSWYFAKLVTLVDDQHMPEIKPRGALCWPDHMTNSLLLETVWPWFSHTSALLCLPDA